MICDVRLRAGHGWNLLTRQAFADSRKDMLTECSEIPVLFEEEVVCDANRAGADLNQVKGVVFPLAAPSPTRCCRSALHDDDPPIAVIAGKEIE